MDIPSDIKSRYMGETTCMCPTGSQRPKGSLRDAVGLDETLLKHT